MESNTPRRRIPSTETSTKSNYDLFPSPPPVPAQRHKDTLQSCRETSAWQQDNEFILTHYRPATHSYLHSLSSLLHLHNQSVSIYPHLLASNFFITCSHRFHQHLATRYNSVSKIDFFVLDCFFLGVVLCLGMSTSFHTFANHSVEIHRVWLVLGMIGMLCLTTGGFFPRVYYAFRCESKIIGIY